MIKITTTKDLQGTEYKIPKETFIWVSFAHSDASQNINVKMTFHKTQQQAQEHQIKRTDSLSEIACGISQELNVQVSQLAVFTGLSQFKTVLQNKIKDSIEELNLSHIESIEVI